jgi:energy-coupling factor transporter ATP-binding protein EcfA2
LNVALELIREPYILFVDEPTSGLSSTDSEKVMLLLKHQARKGKLIIVNIHQPSSSIFKLFDKLWIMDTGGRPIYTGNPLDAIIYFKKEVNRVNADICECHNCGNVNPEQVLEIVETKMIDSSGNFTSERRFSPDFWYSLFRKRSVKSEENNIWPSEDLPKSESRKPGLLKQFSIFSSRNFRIKVSNRQYVLINLLEAPVLAAIVAYFTRFTGGNEYLFYENKNLISYLFMSIVVVLFMGMSISAEEIVRDRKILQRESFLNLSRFSYLNSKILFLLLLSAFQTLSFVMIGNLILGIHGMNNAYWLVLFSVALFSNLLGLNLSSALDSVVTIYILIPLLLIPQMLLSGVIVGFDDLQSRKADKDATLLVGDIMVSRWAFEALAVKQFRDNKYMSLFFNYDMEISQTYFTAEILTTELTEMAKQAYASLQKDKSSAAASYRLNILKNEIEKLDQKNAIPTFQYSDQLTPSSFTLEVADSTKSYLSRIKKINRTRFKEVRAGEDLLIGNINLEHGSQWLTEQKMNYFNKALESLMLNSEVKDLFWLTPNGIMQKVAPVYKLPDFKNGRSHFLASQKRIISLYFDTYWFNISLIAMLCVFLYIALYFDLLRKLLLVSFRPRIRK